MKTKGDVPCTELYHLNADCFEGLKNSGASELLKSEFRRDDWIRIEDALYSRWLWHFNHSGEKHPETLAVRRLWLVILESVLGIKG